MPEKFEGFDPKITQNHIRSMALEITKAWAGAATATAGARYPREVVKLFHDLVILFETGKVPVQSNR